jgi:hypothetical protein
VKKRKGYIEKDKIKLSLFTDDIVVHVENLKTSLKTLLDIIND